MIFISPSQTFTSTHVFSGQWLRIYCHHCILPRKWGMRALSIPSWWKSSPHICNTRLINQASFVDLFNSLSIILVTLLYLVGGIYHKYLNFLASSHACSGILGNISQKKQPFEALMNYQLVFLNYSNLSRPRCLVWINKVAPSISVNSRMLVICFFLA